MKMIKVNFRIEKDMWNIFKLLCQRKTQVTNLKLGISEPATPSWILRELIEEFIVERQKLGQIKSLIREIETENPNAPILKALYEWAPPEEEENKE